MELNDVGELVIAYVGTTFFLFFSMRLLWIMTQPEASEHRVQRALSGSQGRSPLCRLRCSVDG